MNATEVDANKLIESIAKELKKIKEIEPPEWAKFVKTGVAKERLPQQKDWWYIRAASILRKIYFQPLGVSRLRRKYGSRKNRGYKPERFYPGSGSIIRKILQQLEAASLVQKSAKGRELTAKGRQLIDTLAGKVK